PAATVISAKSDATTATAATTIDELLSLLPASDGIAVIDVGRAFNDLLQPLAALNIGDLNKKITEIQEFTGKTGIDLSKAKNAALGLRMNGSPVNGAAIISGLDVDEKTIETTMRRAYKADYRTAEYKGKSIHIMPSGGPVVVSDDETAFASLSRQKFV